MIFTDYSKFRNEFESLIAHYSKFIITGHSSPDPDCVSSCILMQKVLKEIYKIDSNVILRDRIKPMYTEILSDTEKVNFGNPFASVDSETLIILLDANEFRRVGRENGNKKFRSVCIDHHESDPDDFDLYLCDYKNASSTVEILYQVWKNNLNLELADANNIACGIMDDTGGLLYVQPYQTLLVVGELMKIGVNLQDLKTRLFAIHLKPYELFKFMIETSKLENGFVSFLVTEEDLKGYTSDDLAHAKEMITKNVYYYLADADWGAIIYPIETGQAKARLLSRGTVNVNLIAKKFGGGGHKQSSGCKLKGKPETLLAEFQKINQNIRDNNL